MFCLWMLVIMKNWINGNGYLAVDILQVGSFFPLFPGLIGMWNVECWITEDIET